MPVEVMAAPLVTTVGQADAQSIIAQTSSPTKIINPIDIPNATLETKPAPVAEPPKPETTKEQPPSRVAAMIARKEKELRRRSDELNARHESLKAIEERASLLDKAKDDPTVLAQAAGLTLPEYYQKLTKHILANGKIDPTEMIGKTNAEIAALKAEIQRRDEQAKTDTLEAGKLSYIAHIESLAKEKHEVLAMYGREGAEEVLELQVQHFNKTGKSLTDDEAIAKVEEDLKSSITESLEKISKTGFFDTWLKSRQSAKPAVSAATQAQAPSTGMKTIGQSIASTPATAEIRRRSRDDEFNDLVAARLSGG